MPDIPTLRNWYHVDQTEPIDLNEFDWETLPQDVVDEYFAMLEAAWEMARLMKQSGSSSTTE